MNRFPSWKIILPIFAFLALFFVHMYMVKADIVSITGVSFMRHGLPNSDSSNVEISADGNYAVFSSNATNLVSGDNNSAYDVFIYNINTGDIERVSVDSAGTEGNDTSEEPSVSDDGRYVAFVSDATNLVASDTNIVADIFVHDRNTGTTERVSIDDIGTESDGDSYEPSISGDGRYVAFRSSATNLVSGDTNVADDIFVYDRQNDTIERISVDDIGTESDDFSYSPKISKDGLFVTFMSLATNLVASDTNIVADIFVYDLTLNTIERVSVDSIGTEADGGSSNPMLSEDGQFVVFDSEATNLVASDTNAKYDIFVHDRDTGTTERVSLANGGTEGNNDSDYPTISLDGRYVAFDSSATNLVASDTNVQVDVFVYDRSNDTIERASVSDDEAEATNESDLAFIAPDGSFVAFESDDSTLVFGDINNANDIFIRNLTEDTTNQIQTNIDSFVPSTATSDFAKISADGKFIVFNSEDPLIEEDTNDSTDVYVYNRETEELERVSVSSAGVEGDGNSYYADISSDGRYVAFHSGATNLVSGDTNIADDIFVYDRQTDTIERVSVTDAGVEGDNDSTYATISADGRYVAFESNATNFETGSYLPIFVYDRQTDTIESVLTGIAGASESTPYISGDGNYIVFASNNTGLVAGDTNGVTDIFVVNRTTDEVERVSVDSAGVEGNGNSFTPTVSSDGRYVLFESVATNLVVSDSNAVSDIFLHDRNTDTTTRMSVSSIGTQSNGASGEPKISPDGTVAVFSSAATNLVSGDSNARYDIFAHTISDGTVERISIAGDGTQGDQNSTDASVSNYGSYIAFESDSITLIDSVLDSGNMQVYLVNYLPSPPTVNTEGADGVTRTSVTLNGDIDDTGGDSVTTRGFNYGTTLSYGGTVSENGSFGAGNYSLELSGLQCGTQYHFQAFATNSVDTTLGDDETFTTSSCGGGGGGGSNDEEDEEEQTEEDSEQDDELIAELIKIILTPPVENPPIIEPVIPEIPIVEEPIVEEVLPPEITPEVPVEEAPSVENEEVVLEDSINNETIDYDLSIKEQIQSQIQESFENVKRVVSDTKEKVNIIMESDAGNATVKVLGVTGVALSGTMSAASVLFVNPLSFSEIVLLPMRIWSMILAFFGLKRKNRPWGTVYDSITKQPLDPAYVVLQDLNGKEIATSITDIDGRYGFLVQPGTYRIMANKTNYQFPSLKLSGRQSDELYNELYFGDLVTVSEEGGVIAKNIPLDPLKFDWNEFAKQDKKLMRFFSKKDLIIARVTNVFFVIGFLVAILAVFSAPEPYNILIIFFYLLLLVLKRTILKPKPRGFVYKDGQPLAFSIVRFFNFEGREISHKITDQKGNLFCLIPNGEYRISVEQKNFDESYTKVLDNKIISISKGYFDAKIDL